MSRTALLLPALITLLIACSEDPPAAQPRVRQPGEPRRVLIDRILITFRGNSFDIPARRTLDEARRLARRTYERAKAGEDFDELREGFSDDRAKGGGKALGPYVLLNYDVEQDPTMMHRARMQRMAMGRRLGDTAFQMQAGEIALIEYDEVGYPAGFEIIRCLSRDDRTEEQVRADLKRGAPRKGSGGGDKKD